MFKNSLLPEESIKFDVELFLLLFDDLLKLCFNGLPDFMRQLDIIIDASSQHADKRKDIAVRSYSGYSAKVIVRYTGGFTFLQKYDAGDAVLKWQDYLNWWSDGQFYKECGKGDGVFGSNTDSWTKRFQEAVFSKAEADGTVGQRTIQKAREVVK